MSLNYRLYGDSGLLVPNITDESGIEGIKAIESYKQRVLSVMNVNDFAFMPENTRGYNITLSEIYKELGVNFINPDNIFYVDYNGSITSSILDDYEGLPNELKGRKINLFPFINSEKIDS
ncbi:hypothetical protein HUU51_05465, partial [Candidatus Gracilibacteria bacterium]|nr:hypothetical protein [Candidatus Gracilibacteria bacterium]